MITLYDIEAEESTLGSVLLDNGAMPYVMDILDSPQDFYRDKNQWVYEAMLSIWKRHEPLEIVVICRELGDKLEAIGGRDYILYLMASEATSVYAEHYARIVKGCSATRKFMAVGNQITEIAETCEDVPSAISQAQKMLLDIDVHKGRGYVSYDEIVPDALDYVTELFESRFIPGISTGYPQIDKVIGGLQKQNLIVLAGRPGMGKTGQMMQWAYHISKAGHGVGIVSMEMTKKELIMKTACSIAGINMQQLRIDLHECRYDQMAEDLYSSKLVAALLECSELPIYVDDSARQTTSQIESRLTKLIYRHKIDVLFVDHLSLTGDNPNEADAKRLDQICQRFKGITKEYDIPGVVLCQLNRNSEYRDDKRPTMKDLRGSSGIESNADIVIGQYRADCYRDPDTPPDNVLEDIYLKNRNGATNRKTSLYYNAATGFIGSK